MNQSQWIEDNQIQYKDVYHSMRWATPEQIASASAERKQLLDELISHGIQTGYDGTKLDCRRLSPGCESCGNGTWSCLFINGLCNARCFYCPSTQNEKSEPTTNTVQFPNVQDYIDYIELFKFKGIGLSGGEPLLTPDRTLEFLSEIKLNFGDTIHVWLYTNGTKLTEPILNQLKNAGLNEIRFDLVALSYDLEKVKLASRYIDTVTVEIPAIPEDYDLLSQKLQDMKDAGLKFLNLHQLRCTPHNCAELINRNYTFLHGPKVTVLESELTALRLIKYAHDHHIDLPINYCSFIYKNRYQGIAAQKRHAAFIKKPFETITRLGLIRTLSVKGNADALSHLTETFQSNGIDPALWNLDKGSGRMFVDVSLARFIDDERFSLCVGYHASSLKPAISYMNPFKEVRLPSGKKLTIERQPVAPEFEIHGKASIDAFNRLFLTDSPLSCDEEMALKTRIPDIENIWDYEKITPGLMDYF
ncbi:MAG: radical SAM protein [Candidatus Omnitrophota bacterium]